MISMMRRRTGIGLDVSDKDPSFLFNKDTNEIIMVEDLENDGTRISLYRHDRVVYEDNRSDNETIHKFITVMDDLEDQGFDYIRQ